MPELVVVALVLTVVGYLVGRKEGFEAGYKQGADDAERKR